MELHNHKHISSCPKCGGWRYLDGDTITCINCSLSVEISRTSPELKFLDSFKGVKTNGKQTD